MKGFLKSVLANIVAILMVTILVFFLFFLLIVISATGDGKTVVVEKNSILTIDTKTMIVDSPTEERESFIIPQKNAPKRVLLWDAIQVIKKAKQDDKIKGISIEADGLEAGITQLDALRNALEDFKTSGKFVYAYGNNVSQTAYYLGSVADRYFLHPAGGIDLKGLASEVVFFKKFAEKYGVEMDVIRHGQYKAAVEPYLREAISEENREQLAQLLHDVWSKTSASIAKSRKIDTLKLKNVTDSLLALIPENALKYQLADQLVQKSQYDDFIKNKLNVKDEKLSKISLYDYVNTLDNNDLGIKKEKVAVLYASGTIQNGEGYEGIHAKDYVNYIQKLKDDESVKAVVLRINSPGGSANASDEILFELQQLKAKKPLVVSFGDYAASGGYYIAMAADKIYSEPNTLTGSIGVFGMMPNYRELANRNGIRSDVVKTNENAKYYTPLHGLTEGGRAMFTKSVEGTYKRFVHFVTQNRKKTFDQVDAIGGGRVWSGKRAKTLGLVDELGSLDDAIAFATKKAGITTQYLVSYPKQMTLLEEFFDTMDSEKISAKLIKRQLGTENYQLFHQMKDFKKSSFIIMESPYRILLN